LDEKLFLDRLLLEIVVGFTIWIAKKLSSAITGR